MRKYILLFSFVSLHFAAYSQNISGKVTDHHNIPVSGANIILKPEGTSAISNENGEFLFKTGIERPAEILVIHHEYKTLMHSLKGHSELGELILVLEPLPTQIAEVIVKDTYNQTRKQEESLNVEIVNSEFIQRNLSGSLMKTLERLPGIKTIGIGSGQSKPLIRGLGFNRVVVVDRGIKHEGQQWGADHGLEIDQFAAGEIELLKGAASFMYGSDAIGGVIDIKAPRIPSKNTFGGTADLIAKSNNHLYGTSLDLFGRTDKWFFDSRFTLQDYADYRVPADRVFVYDYSVNLYNNRLRNTAGKETGIHLSSGYVGNKFKSIFYLSNSYSESGFFANAHGLEPRRVDENLHDASNRDLLFPRQEVNHLKLINKTSYTSGRHLLEFETGFQRNFRQEFSQYVSHGYMPSVYPAGMNIPEDLEREFNKDVYSANIRDVISMGKHLVTIGANTEIQDNKINGWTFLVPSFQQFTSGAFLYDKVKLTEQIVLHGALRYDHGNLKMFKYTDWFKSQILQNGVATEKNLVRAEDLNRQFNSLVWSAGLNYNKEHFALKVNVGKSFRTPIAKELSANGVNYHYFSYERGNPSLSPEKSYQADLSLGWDFERWSAQVSPFYNYFPNYIYLNPTSEHDFFYGAGNQVFEYSQSRVMRYGGELNLKYNFTPSLSSEILAEYLLAKQLSGSKKGYTLPFSPPASALLNLTWSPATKGKFSNTYLSVDYRITGDQNNIVPPEKKTPGYSLFNIQAGTKLSLYKEPISLSIQIQNLLDAKYLSHTSFYRLIELPEVGRNLVVSLKIPFSIH